MDKRKSNWTATFVRSERIKNTSPEERKKHFPGRRKLFFKNLRDETDLIIHEKYCIEESESIKGGRFEIADVVSFIADKDFESVEFCYPHSADPKVFAEIQKDFLKIKGGMKNEGSK